MNLRDFENCIIELFGQDKLDLVKDNGEFGFTHKGKEDVLKVGYCTNLTIETAKKAVENKVDLILTHHDAWEWMAGFKEKCLNILRENQISHYYIHLPLDDAEFGNNVAILDKLGFTVIDKFSLEDGMYCGRVGRIDEPITLEELVTDTENLLKEKVKYWKNNEKPIEKIGVVTGAGFSAITIKEALELGCDVYLTGEKILYTVEYAEFAGINLIVGSHTFTEIFGVEKLASLIKEKFSDIDIIQIQESHIE